MNYSLILSETTWSFTRISCFKDCKYKFFLKYIQPQDSVNMFFSSYGTFFHEILQGLFSGELTKEEAKNWYLCDFWNKVPRSAPSETIFTNYFNQGLAYISSYQPLPNKVIDTEKRFYFESCGNNFVGVVDAIISSDDGKVSIVDHKSKALKPRSFKKKSKNNAELDEYLRQLYLYTIPVWNEYGAVDELIFNCYRSGEIIREKFDSEMAFEAEIWACDVIKQIKQEEDWTPNMDFFYCKNLCEVHDSCEYYQFHGGLL